MKENTTNFKTYRNIFLAASIFIFVFFGATSITSAAISNSNIINLTNIERSQLGLSQLTENETLTRAAQLKASDMAEKGYFSHNTPDGNTPWSFMDRVGYRYTSAGENLAVDFFDDGAVVKAWMKSPGHRANIANPNYTEIGLAYERGFYQGHETIFVVQMFGVPVSGQSKTNNVSVNVPVVTPTVSPLPVENVADQKSQPGDVIPTVLSDQNPKVEAPVVSSQTLSLISKEAVTGKPVEKDLIKATGTDKMVSPYVVTKLEPTKSQSQSTDFKSLETSIGPENQKENTTIIGRIIFRLQKYISKVTFFWRGLSIAKK